MRRWREHAVTGLARSLAPDAIRASVAVIAVALTLGLPGAAGQLAGVAVGALAGLAFSRPAAGDAHEPLRFPVSRAVGVSCLAVFVVLLVGLPVAARVTGSEVVALLATLAIFAPGFLLLVGVAPFWNRIGSRVGVRAAMRGANAAVVGLLVAALADLVTASSHGGDPCSALSAGSRGSTA